MAVNVDGDLELYALHDTPKQVVWSSKGDLALGAGLGLKVLEGYHEAENNEGGLSKVGTEQNKHSVSNPNNGGDSRDSGGSSTRESERDRTSRSPSQQRPTSATRSLRRPDFTNVHPLIPALPVIPPTSDTPTTTTTTTSTVFAFGEGSDFPSLPTPMNTSTTAPTRDLPATKQINTGRVKNLNRHIGAIKERKSEKQGRKRLFLRSDTFPADDMDDKKEYNANLGALPRSMNKSERPSDAPKSQSRDGTGKARPKMVTSIASLIQGDISMIMKKRVKAGYGLSQVCYAHFRIIQYPI